jgi:hypothetical protein
MTVIQKIVNWFKVLYYDFKIRADLEEHILPMFATRFDIEHDIGAMEKENKYSEALIALKASIKAKAGTDIQKYLEDNRELMEHARKENKLLDAYLTLLDFSSSGVNLQDEKQFSGLIDKRIKHYYDLQQFKLEQELNRKLRAAKNDKVLYTTLVEEWNSKFPNKKLS